MKIVCAAKNCKYSLDNEDSKHIVFINFPNDDTSKLWAHHCGRTDLLMKPNEELHLNYYICSHHIEDRYYISKTDPVIIDQHAIPTIFKSHSVIEKNSRPDFDRNEQPEIADNIVLSYCDMNVEINQYRDVSIKLSNCRICSEPSLDNIEIFSPKGMKLKLKEKINLHLPIRVEMEDLMPQNLCMNCYNKLEIVHSLVLTSLRTDMRLKRSLNINEELNYDHRYSAIAKECSVELTEEMCIGDASGVTSIELSSNRIEEISNYVNDVTKEVEPELNCFAESQNERNKENENYPNNHMMNNEFQCVCCRNIFETQEMLENHKIMCKEVQKGKENESNTNNDFVCYENEKHFTDLSHSKFLEEDYQASTVNKEPCEVHKDSSNIDYIASMENNKKCGHCDSLHNTKKELLHHITEYHKGELLLKCVICDKSYEKWSNLDVHEATHRVDKPYLCDLCGKSFKHSNNLRGHKRTHLDDSKKKRHVCDICGNAFRSRFHLSEHMNQHNGNKPYSCEKCGKAFYKRIQLRQHNLSHGLNKHICPICGVAFNRKGNMHTHLKRHNNENGTYVCSVCTHRCKSMSELKFHRKKHTQQDIVESIRRKRADKTIWQCSICNRIFSTRSVLRNHERIHEKEKTSIECEICGKRLGSKNSLSYHIKSIHSTERPHMCQYCGDSFISKEARLVHERIHYGERPYACKVCEMRYKCSSNLNQHMKIHSGVKPFKCIHCDKSFARKGALNVHERIHTGEKPFACETCDRLFAQKNDMIKHGRTHSAKSLRCERCDEVFVRKEDILKHIALHEQNDPVMQEYVEVQQDITPYIVNVKCPQFE